MLNDELNINRLIIKCLEGEISSEEIEQLNEALAMSPEACAIYAETVFINSQISKPSNIGTYLFDTEGASVSPSFNGELWKELAENEKTAPVVEIEESMPERVLVKTMKIERPPRVINKFSLYSAIISAAAAVIFMLIYVKIVPPAATSVAVIVDSMNAQWEQGDDPTAIGDRLWDNEGARWLKKGTVRIAFDYGAEVIIEGPAEFELKNAEQMILHSGRLCAMVPSGATGFTVETPFSTVIDLGTEFGMEVGFDGTTDVYMFKGKASLIPGQKGDKKESMELVAGQAKAVAQTGQIRDLEFKEQGFVRKFDSKTGLLWRGNNLNLADIVGGGDGFGMGKRDYGFKLTTGEPSKAVDLIGIRDESGQYKLTPNPYVDGVFVPRGGTNPVEISSTGLVFKECPKTSDWTYGYIYNGAWHPHVANEPPHLLKLNGRTFEESGQALYMHSNAGITFDLQAIRRDIPGLDIDAFKATAGVSETVVELWSTSSHTDFWVLVDGQIRLKQIGVDPQSGSFEIDVDLSNQDRFLTIVVTDGGDMYFRDWAMLANPVLILNK